MLVLWGASVAQFQFARSHPIVGFSPTPPPCMCSAIDTAVQTAKWKPMLALCDPLPVANFCAFGQSRWLQPNCSIFAAPYTSCRCQRWLYFYSAIV